MYKLAIKYFSIGIFFGIGFVTVEFAYYKMYSENESVKKVEEIRASFEKLAQQFYEPGYKSFYDRLNEERPEALLNFNLQGFKLLENSVQVSGVVTNSGPGIWEAYIAEVEALDRNGNIFAECSKLIKDLKPGDGESIIFDCPYSEVAKKDNLVEVTFRITRRFIEKRAKE